MARGWESKSVEAQIEMAQSRLPRVTGQALSTAQVTLMREKENTLLSRTRVLHELETSKNPRYVKLLNRELKVLEEKLRRMT
jgi:Tfp pilus assembly protein PilN